MKTFTKEEITELADRVKKTINSVSDMIKSYHYAKEYFSILSNYLPVEYELKNMTKHPRLVYKEVEKKAWEDLLWKTNIFLLVTKQRADNLKLIIKQHNKYFTADEIESFLNGLQKSEPGFILESIEYLNGYTQGNKLVIPNFIENVGINFERAKIISLLVNIVYYHQNKELNKLYDNEITDAIKNKRSGFGIFAGEAESENFKLKWFANGNLHITFKDAMIFKKLTA